MSGAIDYKAVITNKILKRKLTIMISKMNYDDIPASQTAAKTGATVDALARAYLRSVRAAEMAMWEMTGGDYVLSRFAPKRTQSPGNFSLLAGS